MIRRLKLGAAALSVGLLTAACGGGTSAGGTAGTTDRSGGNSPFWTASRSAAANGGWPVNTS